MKIAVLSDIHGNLEAFRAVLEDLDGRVDEVISLGDNIGYGPDSESVIHLLEERKIRSVLGNHELALLKEEFRRWFNPQALESLDITMKHLSEESLSIIARMKNLLTFSGCRFVHGAPPSSCLKYLFELSDATLKTLFGRMDENICFVGHTHDLRMVRFDGDQVEHLPLAKGRQSLHAGCRYIFNIGSVGQPRDGNNNAKYAVYDSLEHSLEMRFVPYDIGRTVEKILKMGFPVINAERLW